MQNGQLNSLAPLQAFVDLALEERLSRTNDAMAPNSQPRYVEEIKNAGRIRAKFLREAVRNSEDYRALAAQLRRAEIYEMVSFLLREEVEQHSITSLSSRYGVSPSHFRRLFRKSMGIAPKSAMKAWRMAKAVLAIVDSRRPITEVALEHGYASPSHFSKEFRDAVGSSLTDVFEMKNHVGNSK